MTGHPSLLAPPPPLANITQEAPLETPPPEHAALSKENATANLQAGLTSTSDSLADQPAEAQIADAQPTAIADNTEVPKKQFKDFLTQATEIAFGPNHEKNTGPDFKKYGETLVENNILPAFAISDNSGLQLKVALNTGQDKAQYMFDHFEKAYRALKA